MDPRIITNLDQVPQASRRCVLTIGNFDGVHIGHQRILLTCKALAAADHLPVIAMTFDPLPEAVLHPEMPVPPLISEPQRNRMLLLEHGADLVVNVTTTPALLSLPPRGFIELLLKYLQPMHIVEGEDFFFGRRRSGNVVTLENIGATRGFSVTTVESVVLKFGDVSRRVSSTLIREFVALGQIEDANYCLGRPFTLCSTVIQGEGRGRLLEFPTANIDPGLQVMPGEGVYAAKATIDGKEHISAVSVGRKLTFGPAIKQTVEAFLIDAQGDFYDKEMALSFHRRLRDQRKFESPDALREQIAADVQGVRKTFE